eukprot:1139136-Pelagomonas_calceolata.AAC.2
MFAALCSPLLLDSSIETLANAEDLECPGGTQSIPKIAIEGLKGLKCAVADTPQEIRKSCSFKSQP